MWTKYILFAVTSFLTSLVGSQCVHWYYQPMADFEDLVDLEFNDLKEQMESEIKS